MVVPAVSYREEAGLSPPSRALGGLGNIFSLLDSAVMKTL